jgi:hypothetical protein
MHTAGRRGQQGPSRTHESPLTLPITGRGDAEPQRPSFFLQRRGTSQETTVIQPKIVIPKVTPVWTVSEGVSSDHPYYEISASPRPVA